MAHVGYNSHIEDVAAYIAPVTIHIEVVKAQIAHVQLMRACNSPHSAYTTHPAPVTPPIAPITDHTEAATAHIAPVQPI